MIRKVFQQLEENNISQKSKILCAISGGIDSVSMLHLLNDYKFDCIVAHCNFKLRGSESDGDENFVRHLSKKLEFRFVSQTFDTEGYAKDNGISIQMAARDLRYNYFHKLMKEYNCDFLALAHNSDDQAETLITNLIRGTGIRGLTGMDFVKDTLLRPIINISRNEIETYVKMSDIEYRIDSTNKTTKYSRNKIRHSIFPLMEEISPAFKKNILKSVGYLKDTEQIMNAYVELAKKSCLYYKNNKTIIEINELEKFSAKETLLFEILVQEEIPKNLAVEAISLLNSQTGKFCSIYNIEILRDRDNIVIDRNVIQKDNLIAEIYENELEHFIDFGYKCEIIDKTEDFEILKAANIAYIDYDKIKFPIKIRYWQDGDKFKPLGMNNFKKLSDFFSDIKLSKFQKSEIRILESNKDIVWISGCRIDDRYKISNSTEKIIVISEII